MVLFVGDDWSEAHHDIEIQDETGRPLVRRRLPEGVAGIAALHELIGAQAGELPEPPQVVVGIETDRGAWVQALLAAGYEVYAINPLSVARYRERYTTSGAKSDAGDAHVLADLVRTDRHAHRPIAGTASWRRGSRCSPARTSRCVGSVGRRPTSFVRCCASSTRPRWWPSRN